MGMPEAQTYPACRLDRLMQSDMWSTNLASVLQALQWDEQTSPSENRYCRLEQMIVGIEMHD